MAARDAAGPLPVQYRRAAVGVLAALSLAWLGIMLWVAHASVSSDTGVVALATAASSLPNVVSAAIVAGAATGLIGAGIPGEGRPSTGGSAGGPTGTRSAGSARTRFGGFARTRFGGSTGTRFGAAVTAGALTGLAAGGAFVAGSGTDPARMVLAGTLAAGATIGGAVAGARAARIVPSIVAAALGVFATAFVFGLFKAPIQDFYGAGGGAAASLSAAGWFAATAAGVSGLAAGLIAYRLLGGSRRAPELRWPAYLAAGAGPGVLLLVTEVIVRTGGAGLLALVRDNSAADRAIQSWADGSRVNNALVVGFVGAIVALVAVGRTLGPAPDVIDPHEPPPGAVGSDTADSDTADSGTVDPETADSDTADSGTAGVPR